MKFYRIVSNEAIHPFLRNHTVPAQYWTGHKWTESEKSANQYSTLKAANQALRQLSKTNGPDCGKIEEFEFETTEEKIAKRKNINEVLNKYIKEAKVYYSNDQEYTDEVIPDVQGYIWRANDDEKVRPSHLRMDGKFVPYNKPPTLDGIQFTNGPGSCCNCRCWAEHL